VEGDIYCLIWIASAAAIVTRTQVDARLIIYPLLNASRFPCGRRRFVGALINRFRLHTGALPGLLHPQRRRRPGAPAHRQHVHEPAQAPGVLRPAPDEEQAVVRHRVLRRLRAELRRGRRGLLWPRIHGLAATRVAWEKKTHKKEKKERKERESRETNDALTCLIYCVCVCLRVCVCVSVPSRGNDHTQTEAKRSAEMKRGMKPFFYFFYFFLFLSLLLLSNLTVLSQRWGMD